MLRKKLLAYTQKFGELPTGKTKVEGNSTLKGQTNVALSD